MQLNTFKSGYFSWSRIRNWPVNIKIFFRNIRYAWQRATTGYSIKDLCDLDMFYSALVINSLRDFAAIADVYPSYEFNGTKFYSLEEWHRYLYKIADLLEHSYSETYYVNEYDNFKNGKIGEAEFQIWQRQAQDIEEMKRLDRRQALEMLVNIYDLLWR